MRVRSPDRRNLLEDRVALIVGGAGSLGLATARLFLKEGARVVLTAQDAGALKTAESTLDDVNVATVVSDPTREDDVAATADAVIDRHGRLDVLVVDTGTPALAGPVTELGVAEFDRFLAVHVRGTFLACKHGLRLLEDGGTVVIVSGVAALRAEAGSSAAAAVEHAQVGLMRSLAKEAAVRGIRVNTVRPGSPEASADLSQVPLGRPVRADEIARSVLYLASAQSSFTTGTSLVVDGGLTS